MRAHSAVRERTLLALFLALVPVLAGCSEGVVGQVVANRRPSVEFTQAPISQQPDDPAFYAYRVHWSGHDPDGRVERFEYCIDPTPTDSVWVRTTRSEEVIFFRATEPVARTGPVRHATSPHVLVLRAVDNQGAISPFKTRAFYSYTIAPDVQIRSPLPSALIQASIVPSVFVRWDGHDPDGQLHDRPVHYRHLMLPLDDPGNRVFLSDPDSLRRRDAPRGFADWDSSGADTTFVRVTDLTPGSQYLFVVVAYDEAGAYSPVFSLYENMLQMFVTLSATGPRIHVYSEMIDYTYESGGYTVDPLRWIPVEAGHGEPVTFHWDAIPSPGSAMETYRWALDLTRLDDPTPRSDEELDTRHWSRASPLNTSCTLSGLSVGTHFLYIEARDNNELSSLGVVQLTVVAATFESELLIVDDTRLEPDKFSHSGAIETYKSPWPSATELDTFLYARGGVPWRQTQEPASGVVTLPGVFAGYPSDTLGTRLGYENPTHATRLSRLAQYRHVVWMVDRRAATNLDVLGNNPMPALRYMSTPGRASALGAYLALGGRVWLCGGASGVVSTDQYNRSRNDDTFGRVYSVREGELGAGRVLYDGAHWRSAFTANVTAATIARTARADAIAAAPWTHDDRWTGAPLTAPDYRRLPGVLRYRDPAVDPMPPTRRASQFSSYYSTATTIEYLIEPNFVTENVDLTGTTLREESVLDTLYEARSVVLRVNPAPTMTWYHGREANRFVFSGFGPWEFRREDCIALADFVLQDLWGIPRQAIDRGGPAAAAVRAVPARSPGPRPGLARSPALPAGRASPGVTPTPLRR